MIRVFLQAVAITVVIVMAFSLSMDAAGASVCLTKREARELWPKAHIYWFGKNRCWSNRRGPPRGLKIDPIKKTHAEAIKQIDPPRSQGDTTTPWVDIAKNDKEVVPTQSTKSKKRSGSEENKGPQSVAPAPAERPAILYPSLLNLRSPIDASLLNSLAGTYNYRILDIDDLTARRPHDDEDYCCWPLLDEKGNIK